MTNTAKGYLEIDGEEFEVDIDYDYQPAEKAVLYPNDDAYPGCPEEYEVTKVSIDGIEIKDIYTDGKLEYLEQCCEDHHHDEAAALAESKADAEYNDRLEWD